jgi:hypothetical protein
VSDLEDREFDELIEKIGDSPDPKEALEAALEETEQKPTLKKLNEMLDTVHVPKDAGQYKDILTDVMKRIPPSWGRWISCQKGWYPLIAETHQALVDIFPNYQVHQVKEKYGGLRYYWGANETVQMPGHPCPRYPGPDAPEYLAEQYKKDHLAWHQLLKEYLESETGQAASEQLNERHQKADRIVEAAEKKSLTTCELCGEPGQLAATRAASSWYQTLCDAHIKEKNMIAAKDWEQWWDNEGSQLYLERMQNHTRKELQNKRVVIFVKNPDPQKELIVDAETITEIGYAQELIKNPPDAVFLANDELAIEYLSLLSEPYLDQLQNITDSLDYIAIDAKERDKFPDIYHYDDQSWPRELNLVRQRMNLSARLNKDYFWKDNQR